VPPGIRVVEVDRSGGQDRRRQGKSDPLDAVSAARPAQSGRAAAAPKGRDGTVEAIRALMIAKRGAAGERTQTINQARALVLTRPDELQARFTRHTRLRWWPGRGLRHLHRAARAGTARGCRLARGPRGHRLASQAEGFWPAAVTAPRHPSPSPGTSATRASTPYRWPAPARPGATYLRNSG
jgi:hypothetical protein